jgi:hypothetical protein
MPCHAAQKGATTLYQFKGYSQCIDMFINQHEFFYDEQKLYASRGRDACHAALQMRSQLTY